MPLGIPGFIKKSINHFWPLGRKKPPALYSGPEKNVQRRFLAHLEAIIETLPENQKTHTTILLARAKIDRGLLQWPDGRKETVDAFATRLWREHNNVRATFGIEEKLHLSAPAPH